MIVSRRNWQTSTLKDTAVKIIENHMRKNCYSFFFCCWVFLGCSVVCFCLSVFVQNDSACPSVCLYVCLCLSQAVAFLSLFFRWFYGFVCVCLFFFRLLCECGSSIGLIFLNSIIIYIPKGGDWMLKKSTRVLIHYPRNKISLSLSLYIYIYIYIYICVCVCVCV